MKIKSESGDYNNIDVNISMDDKDVKLIIYDRWSGCDYDNYDLISLSPSTARMIAYDLLQCAELIEHPELDED